VQVKKLSLLSAGPKISPLQHGNGRYGLTY